MIALATGSRLSRKNFCKRKLKKMEKGGCFLKRPVVYYFLPRPRGHGKRTLKSEYAKKKR